MHALPTLLPGQWHAGLKAVKSILRRIFIKRDRAWKAYTKVCGWHVHICCLTEDALVMQRQQPIRQLHLLDRSADWQPLLSGVCLTHPCAPTTLRHPAQKVHTRRGRLLAWLLLLSPFTEPSSFGGRSYLLAARRGWTTTHTLAILSLIVSG